nr:retrovirus-related Pol polyprotein from transposon TNT 1-94 [Tanacetum cinerariifolium]
DFQDSLDDEEDTRRSQEYLKDLKEEYQAKALLAKSKRFFKKGSQRFSGAMTSEGPQCHKCVFSTPLPPLKKLVGAEPVSGPNTIKSILKSNFIFKAKALKGVIINDPSSAPAKGKKVL